MLEWMIAREAGVVHRELTFARQWRWSFQQTQVELGRGFGAMQKVIFWMLDGKPDGGESRRQKVPKRAADRREAVGTGVKTGWWTRQERTTPLRAGRAARYGEKRRGS